MNGKVKLPEDGIRERLNLECSQGTYIYIHDGNDLVTLDGALPASDLRKIADELDRLSNSE